MKHLYLLIVLFCTSYSIQANTNISIFEQQEYQTSSDSIVCDISVYGVSIPGFTPLDTIYDVTIPYNSPIPVVEIMFCDTNDIIIVDIVDATVVPGTSTYSINSSQGNITYYINWIYELPSSDADLISLTGITGYLCQPFHPDSLNYQFAVGAGFMSLAGLSAEPSDSLAMLTLTGSATVSPYGTLVIMVTAQDEITTKVYTVEIVESCPPNFDLILLSDSNAIWCEEFSSDQYIYYVQVDSSFTKFQILENISGVDTSAEIAVYISPEDPEDYIQIGIESFGSMFYYEVYLVDSCPPLSIGELIENSIILYPNPSSDIVNIHVENDDQATLTILDVSGRSVKELIIEKGEEAVQIDVSKFPKGMYFIQLYENGKLLMNEKLMVE